MTANMRLANAIWVTLALGMSASPLQASTDTGSAAYAHGGGRSAASDAGRAAENVDAPANTNPAAEPQARPDLSGLWALNAAASDDPEEKVKSAMRQAMGGGRGMMAGGFGGTGRGGGMGGRQGRGHSEGKEGRRKMASGDMPSLIDVANRLDIIHDDPQLLITDENAQRQSLFTDFRGASVSANGDLNQRVVVAGWERAALVVETTMRNGTRRIQNYQIDAGTGQLTIATTVNLAEMPPVSYRLVYDRVKPLPDAGDY